MGKMLTLLFMVLVLTSCSDEKIHYDYTFEGEGEYWEADYSFWGTEVWGEKEGTMTYSNDNSEELLLTYKGSLKELSSVKTLEYAYETSAGGGEGTLTFDEPPTKKTFKMSGDSGNGAKVLEDEVIKVNVKWDRFEESFELYNTGK